MLDYGRRYTTAYVLIRQLAGILSRIRFLTPIRKYLNFYYINQAIVEVDTHSFIKADSYNPSIVQYLIEPMKYMYATNQYSYTNHSINSISSDKFFMNRDINLFRF